MPAPNLTEVEKFFLEQNIFDLLGVKLSDEQKSLALTTLTKASIHKAFTAYLTLNNISPKVITEIEQKLDTSPDPIEIQTYILELFPDFNDYVDKSAATVKKQAFIQQLKDVFQLIQHREEPVQNEGEKIIFDIESSYIDDNLQNLKDALNRYSEFKLKYGI